MKEHDEISKIFNFEVTDVKVRHFTVILMFKKLPTLIGKKLLGGKLFHPAYKSFIIFKLSNCPKILHLNVSGLQIGNPTNFMMPFPPRGGGNSHMKVMGMLVVSLRVVKCRFWSHLGC